MADDITLNSGSGGAVVATDEITSRHFQKVKLVTGADGTATDVDPTSNGLPVSGPAAHDATIIGNPVIIGGHAKATAPADVSGDGDAVKAWFDRAGRLQIGDGGGSLTIDGSVTSTATCAGDVAHDGGDSGNPVKVGGKAANALPTAVSNGDRANLITDLWGRALVSHIDPAMQVWKQVEATSTQTGTAIWTPSSGKKIAITHLQIATGGTTAGVLTIWFGAGGGSPDTTFTQGTDQVVFRGEFAPSSTVKSGALPPLPTPIFSATADYVLRYTTSAGMTVYITVYGYEF